MHNKVKSEQWFTVTSAKRVAIFQIRLKLVKRSEPNSLTGIKTFDIPWINYFCEGGCCK